jgi:hypothetical protein
MNRLVIYSYVACGVGVAMLITGLLPQDKIDRVRALLGDKRKFDQQPTARTQLLVFGAVFLFIGLMLLGVIRF